MFIDYKNKIKFTVNHILIQNNAYKVVYRIHTT